MLFYFFLKTKKPIKNNNHFFDGFSAFINDYTSYSIAYKRVSRVSVMISYQFLQSSDHLDKQHLEKTTANQLRKRIDHSRDSLRIARKGDRSREVSPLFKQQTRSAQDRERAKTLKALPDANAKWNAERRRLAGHDLQQLVDDRSTIDPELRKEQLYS